MKKEFIKKYKKAQDEMVGFGLIIIVMAVIIIAFVAAMVNSNKENEIENYEVNAFVQATLQYTTICKMNGAYLDISDLIFECENNAECENQREACAVLEGTLEDITSRSWTAGEEEYVKGYKFTIVVDSREIINPVIEGSFDSKNYRDNPITELTKEGSRAEIYFTVYY